MTLSYLISDLHLGPDAPELTELFLGWLQALPARVNSLYILGDLFESWIGDDDDQALLTVIADALKQRQRLGTSISFLHGNRDFLLGRHYAARAGMTLLPPQQSLVLHGREFLALHGDELCLGDTAYQKFRAMVRQPAWQQQVLSLPLAVRRAKANELRQLSQEQTRAKADAIMDVDPSEVSRVLALHRCNLMVHGHTHRPAVHGEREYRRVVLGDWGRHPSFLEVRDGHAILYANGVAHEAW
jgi:UDP-2,3-diacylglucosamine hydrolase